MNARFFLLVVAFFVGTMAVAYPWHMVFFHEQYVAMGAFTRLEPIMPFGMTAVLIQAVVFAYLFPIYLNHSSGGSIYSRAIRYCLMLGLIVYSVMVFATAAKFEIEPVGEFLMYGTAFQLLQFLVVGTLFGLVFRRSG